MTKRLQKNRPPPPVSRRPNQNSRPIQKFQLKQQTAVRKTVSIIIAKIFENSSQKLPTEFTSVWQHSRLHLQQPTRHHKKTAAASSEITTMPKMSPSYTKNMSSKAKAVKQCPNIIALVSTKISSKL